MAEVVVLIPVLGRPARVQPLLDSLHGSEGHHKLHPLFLCSPHDDEEIAAVQESSEDYILMPQFDEQGDYARKMNCGIRNTEEPWIFLGADDLCFCPGWADEAIRVGKRTNKPVIGTNDLGNRHVIAGKQSTHTLIHRSYVEQGTIDDPSRLLHEGYGHNFVDIEFVETARHRDAFVHAHSSMVEHLHPNWGKAPMDPTYALALDGKRVRVDARLYMIRQRLWKGRKATSWA